MSMFDPNAFLDQAVTEANDTVMIPVPAGEYLAVIDKVEAKQWSSKSDPSKAGLKLQVTWSIDDAAVKQQLGRDTVTVRQDIMLDTTDTGGLDVSKGKNIGLGKLRQAVDLNVPGQPFSPTMLPGRMAKVVVAHRVDGENVYAEVKGVAHA